MIDIKIIMAELEEISPTDTHDHTVVDLNLSISSTETDSTKSILIIKGTRMITDLGLANIEDLSNKELNIWTGKKWTPCKIESNGKSNALYKVNFHDGTFLYCVQDHKFPVYQKNHGLVQLHPNQLRTGNKIYTFHYDHQELDMNPDINSAPYKLGFQIASHQDITKFVPIKDSITNFSLSELVNFVSGWSKFYNGMIIGQVDTLREIQYQLHRHIVTVTFLDMRTDCTILYLSDEYQNIFKLSDTNGEHLFYKKLKNGCKRITSIELINKRKSLFNLTTSGACSIITNNTVLHL